MTDTEIDFIMDAIESTAWNYPEWKEDYSYDPGSNEYVFKGGHSGEQDRIRDWFNLTPQ
jgi:hypothetical protein